MKLSKFIFFFLFVLVSYHSHSASKKNILIIGSYHSEFSWDMSYRKGIKKVLGDAYQIKTFEMDTKRRPNSEYPARGELAWKEYLKVKPILVFIADDNALKLLGSRFAATNTPVVYLGINNNPRIYNVSGKKNITGVLERPFLRNSVTVIRNLIPECRKVLIVLDSGTTSKIIAKDFHSASKRMLTVNGIEIEIKLISKIDKWKQAVKDAKNNGFDAIILGMFHTITDSKNRPVDADEIIRWSSQNSTVPPFCFWDFAVGADKTIGGIVLFGETQGEAAAKIALRILNGESPGNIIPEIPERGRRLFSRAQLEKWNLYRDNSLALLGADFTDQYYKLRLKVWKGYAPASQVKKFEKYIFKKFKQRVKLEVAHISNPNDFYDPVRLKKVDIISPAHNLYDDSKFNYKNKGFFLTLNLKNIPNFKNILPVFQKAGFLEKDNKIFGIPFIQGSYALIYNADKIDEPKSWNIFWNSKVKDQYAVSSDYYECNIYITALALGFKPNQLSNADRFFTKRFEERLKVLVKNSKRLWQGVDTASDLKGLTIATSWGFSLPELNKKKRVWKIAEPKEGTLSWVDTYAICWSLRNKPFLKKIAEEWLNFVISPSFQIETVIDKLGCEPVSVAIKNYLTAEQIKKYHLNDLEYFEKKRIMWPTLKQTKDRNIMEHLWQEANDGK